MNENDGRSPASQGRAGGLRPEPATQSQPEALVPNAEDDTMFIVAVVMQRATTTGFYITPTTSWCRGGTRDEAIGSAVEYALKAVPGSSIATYLVTEIPASGIEARSDATGTGAAEGKSPAPEGGDAQRRDQ